MIWTAGFLVFPLAGLAGTVVAGRVDERFTIFGVSGAFTFSALSGLLLHQLLPDRAASVPRPAPHTPIEAKA